jgi:inorganic pyrophosphatase
MFDHIQIPEGFPEKINMIVEIPRGSHSKYEYDEHLGIIKLDRVLHSSVVYPTDYGFVPATLSEDGDHLDVLLLTSDPLFPGCLVTARIIGVADMEDEAGKDWKLLAVADHDPRYTNTSSLADVDKHRLDEIQNFFEVYKLLEKKQVIFHGWKDRTQAYTILREARERSLSKENNL